MVNPEKKHSAKDRHIDDVDHADQISNGEGSFNDLSSSDGTSTSENPSITGRLVEILVEDGDLLLQRSHWEGEVLQLLRALDLQVMGACRADERLKPMLKLNVSPGAAEDHLLAHISQHFEPPEIGILAMCLCVPLVSIRVGKVNKQGACLYPTSIRGHLNLTLLPTSNLRISFNGDDGCMERLATSSPGAQCPGVEIEEISADKSGRSFLVKNPVGEISYFWCSEKSKLLGSDLLRKMKNLLTEKPSLAELTGISESRLNCFASLLRAYLAGSVMNSAQASRVLSDTLSLENSVDSPRLSFTSPKTSHFRHNGSQGSKTNLMYQGSLSPRSSSFTGLPRSLSLLRSKEKVSSPGESYISSVDNLNVASPNCADPPSLNCFERDRLSEATGADVFPQLSFLDALEKSTDLYLSGPEARVPSSSSCLSPHYCWCPPVASSLQYPIGTPQLPISIIESVSLPPLSSFLSTTRPLKPSEPPVDFPPLLAEPSVRLPLTRPTSQQIPTFTPLICDPIVHIPVINVCSSGQGYLVTAGPAISTVISPFIPSLVEPLIPDAESVVEKGARETLRMLISSSNEPNPQLFDVLPSVLARSKDKNILSLGSRGLYIGTRDVGAISNSMTTRGLASVSEKSMGGSVGKRYIRRDDLGCQNGKTSGSGLSNSDDPCSNLRDSGTH